MWQKYEKVNILIALFPMYVKILTLFFFKKNIPRTWIINKIFITCNEKFHLCKTKIKFYLSHFDKVCLLFKILKSSKEWI